LKYVLLVLCISLLSACAGDHRSRDDRPNVRIGYLPITHAMALFVANDMLCDDAPYGMVLERFSSWPDLMDALNGGHIDGASVLIQLAMASHYAGVDLRAVALGHRDGNIVAVANYIETVQDLRGRIVAIPSPMSTHSFLLKMLLWENGMTDDDVTIIQLPPAEMVPALASGSISGYVVAEPFGARAVTLGVGRKLAESGEIWENSICCALVFSSDFIKNNAEAADFILQKYHEAADFLQQNLHPMSDNIQEIAMRHLLIDEETLMYSIEWISFDSLFIDEEEYAELYRLTMELGLLSSPPPFDDFINSVIERRP